MFGAHLGRFCLFSVGLLSVWVESVSEKTKKSDVEDDDKYYKYKVENVSLHWDQYWIERKSVEIISSGLTSYGVDLPFNFSFYGHPVSKIFIFPAGYISTTDIQDEQASKYIAPLLSNLDPHHDESSRLSFWIDKRNTSITVEWKQAVVKDLPSRLPFTLRAKIWSSGLIEFTYDYLGIDLSHLLPFDKDFKIGIGDSVTNFGHIYRYHSVDIPRDAIHDKTKVTFWPLPTCTTKSSCDECVQDFKTFHCFWCPAIKKCISGMDFHRPEYANEPCNKANSGSVCKVKKPWLPSTIYPDKTNINISSATSSDIQETTEKTKTESTTITTITTITATTIQTTDSTAKGSSTENPSDSSIYTSLPTRGAKNPVPSDRYFLYYNTSLVTNKEAAKKLWVDMSDTTTGKTRSSIVTVSRMQAHQVKLPFPFRFFGNMKNQLSFTGDGFISTMDSWMIHDKTHFIAPLKGLFGQKFQHMRTSVNYKITSRSVTVEWKTKSYQNNGKYVPFEFQATLHSNGDIDFVYINFGKIGLSVDHFIGLSEGHSEEMRLGFLLQGHSDPIKYKEYHNVNLTDWTSYLSDWTAIQITSLPTCSGQSSCGSCLSMPDISGFKCGWCPAARLCRGSNEAPGEDWVVRNCYTNMVHHIQNCPAELKTKKPSFEDLKYDDHKYYRSRFFKDSWENYFVDFSKLKSSSITDLWKTSNNFLTADPYTLSFLFPFYGHPVEDIMVLSGGFISLPSLFSKRNLLEHEYIAPLMADLDASYSKEAKIQIYEQDSAVTISWSKMKLVSRPDIGEISFQLTLVSNGTIIFCYQDIPADSISKIISSDTDILHPIRIGLSDSFLYKDTKHFTNKTVKKMYKYHELDLKIYADKIESKTGILLEPLPTCNTFSSCHSCLKADPLLNCVWCPGLQFCSDGMDRKYQEWDDARCFHANIGLRNVNQCPLEMHVTDRKYYKRIIYTQDQSLWSEKLLKPLKLDAKDANYFVTGGQFKFPFFEEEVSYLRISSHGVVGITNTLDNHLNSSQDSIMYKYIAPFKMNLEFGTNGEIYDGEVKINGVSCYGIEWKNALYAKSRFASFKCGLCEDGTIYFQYDNLSKLEPSELRDLGLSIGLWHGVARDEFIDMAFDQLEIHDNLTFSGLVVKFSPKTSCSLSTSCLFSSSCRQYSDIHNCSRLSCEEPVDHIASCEEGEKVFEKTEKYQGGNSWGLTIFGVVGGVVLVVLIVGVLVYGLKRLDGRPGRWQHVHSIFQPGYHIFRSGADIGSREVLSDEGMGVEEIDL